MGYFARLVADSRKSCPRGSLVGRKYFGTDGIRGRANAKITAEVAMKVGQAAGLVFQRGDHHHRVVTRACRAI